MSINIAAIGAGFAALVLVPVCAVRQYHRSTQRKAHLKAMALVTAAEISDLLLQADSMLTVLNDTRVMGQRLVSKKLFDELVELRNLGRLCERMAMPEMALKYARRAASQVQTVLARIGTGSRGMA